MRVPASLANTARAVADFIYPPVCSTCAGQLSKGEAYICWRCWNSFEKVAPTETMIQTIEAKFLSDEAVDRVVSVFLFEQDPRVRTAVHLLKYAGAEAISERLGTFIAGKIVDDARLSVCDFIAPVPLHPVRKRERGYNQSELISGWVSRHLKVPHAPDLLKRTRQTRTQTFFDAEGRKQNIKGAFTIGPKFADKISGRKILLIDDVITTGSTVKECAMTLKMCGVTAVYAASGAITV